MYTYICAYIYIIRIDNLDFIFSDNTLNKAPKTGILYLIHKITITAALWAKSIVWCGKFTQSKNSPSHPVPRIAEDGYMAFMIFYLLS